MKKILSKKIKNFLSILLSFSIIFNFLIFSNFEVNWANFTFKLNWSFNDLQVSSWEIFTAEVWWAWKNWTWKLILRNWLSYITPPLVNWDKIEKIWNNIFFKNWFNFVKIQLIATEDVSDLKILFDTEWDDDYNDDFSNNINIDVNTDLKINSAEYLDWDKNWKLDSVKITFNQNPSWDMNSWFSVWNYWCWNSRDVTGYSVSWSVLGLTFSECDNYDTWIIPQLNYSWWNFTWLWDVWDDDLIEKDGASAMNITWSLLVNVDENIVLPFSEFLSSWTWVLKTSTWVNVEWVSSSSTGYIIFNPSQDLVLNSDYIFDFTNIDFAWNIKTWIVSVRSWELPTWTWGYTTECPTSCWQSATTQTQVCSWWNWLCSWSAWTRTCNATASCSSGGWGWGWWWGWSFWPTVWNYTLPSSESDKIVDTFDNIDLKKIENWVITRPLKMKELWGKYFVEVEKLTVVKDEKWEFFNWKILAPARLSTSKLPNIDTKTKEFDKWKYALRAIEIWAKEWNLSFDKDIRVTISVKWISEKLKREFINIYSYDEIWEKYVIENKNRVYDEKTDAITVSVNHMTKFIAVWEDWGYKWWTWWWYEEIEKSWDCKIKDISNHWSKDFVSQLCVEKIVSWEWETWMFKPDNSINRAALLKMLMISFWYEIDSTFSEKYFDDIRWDERFANYVNTEKKMWLIEWYKVENNIQITHNLQEKDYWDEVIILQNFLTKKWFYNYTITWYYWWLTKLALQKYQQSVWIMTVWNLWPKTLEKINEELSLSNWIKYEFRAASYINRAEALAMILKVWKKSDFVKSEEYWDFNEFWDVLWSNWFWNYVKYWFEKWIISWKSKWVFLPWWNITKWEVSKIIIKTRELK